MLILKCDPLSNDEAMSESYRVSRSMGLLLRVRGKADDNALTGFHRRYPIGANNMFSVERR